MTAARRLTLAAVEESIGPIEGFVPHWRARGLVPAVF